MTDLMDTARPVAEPAAGEEPGLAGVLEALRLAAIRMLASAPRAPHRLRLEAAGVSVELGWPETAAAERFGLAPAPRDEVLALLGGSAPAMNPLPENGSHHRGNDNGRADGALLTEPRLPATDPDVHCVCAPTVGTFYRAAEPGSKPFVAVGDLVTVGQQLAIVEAMKLMIPVEADRAGRVREILATDATAVEYGERLIAIDHLG